MSIRRKVVIEASEDTLESCAGLFHIKAVGLWETGGDKELAATLRRRCGASGNLQERIHQGCRRASFMGAGSLLIGGER